MNVSELSDVELNRAMIKYYPPVGESFQDPDTGTTYDCEFDEPYVMDYLQDWNLTMPLAVKNKLCIDTEGFWDKDFEDFLGVAEVCTEDGQHVQYGDPLRAICEVLVMIKMESK